MYTRSGLLTLIVVSLAPLGCHTTNLDKNWDSARQEVIARMIANPSAGEDDSVQPADGVSTEQALEGLRTDSTADQQQEASTTLIHLE